jgi:hypothetical protein
MKNNYAPPELLSIADWIFTIISCRSLITDFSIDE